MLKLIPENDKKQALRIKRFFMALGSYAMWVILTFYCYFQGFFRMSLKSTLTCFLLVALTNLILYILFRTGCNKKFHDQSLTAIQIVVGTFWAMVIVYYTDEARGAMLLLFLIVFVFGMFRLKLKQFQLLAFFSIGCYAVVIYLLFINRPDQMNIKVELMNMLILAVVLPWFAFLGSYINNLRSELVKTKTIVENMAIHDDLTGAYNRRQLYKILKREKSLADRTGPLFSISIIDIDHFKKVNDTHGHLAGDLVLKELVHEIKKSLRSHDYLARMGGEEFVIILAYPNLEQAIKCSRRIKRKVADLSFSGLPESFRITISMGVTKYFYSEPIEKTLSRADKALYRAKEMGRNRVETQFL